MRSAQIRISFRIGSFAFFALLALAALTAGCRVAPTTPPEGSYVSTTIAGQITDESGAPLAGVAITAGPAGNTIATTDVNGLFALHSVSVAQNHAFIIAQKSGYFNGARACAPTVNGVTYMSLSMASSAPIGTISGTSGGSVTLPGGGSVSLSAGGVVTSSGSAYTGTVSVSAKHLDPSNATFSHLFAGDLSGQRTDGSSAQLQSYGVIIAELHGSNGELLQPASGQPATLTMPISASLLASAPASIPLWYFDETLGLWKEEGTATKSGNSYTGTVTHFTFWNYDMQCPYGTITGQIICNGTPIPGVTINLGAYVEGGQPNVVTDGGGHFSVRVPANSTKVILQVLASENHGLFYTNTPMPVNVPPNVTTDLGQISLNSPCPNYLMGQLNNCNGQPIAGMVMATWAGGMSYVYTTDGNFRLTAPAGTALSMAATAASGDIAQPQIIMAGAEGVQTTTPALVACNNQASDIHIDISGSFNGKALAFSPDGLKLATIASNGTDVVILDVATGNTLTTIPAGFSSSKYSGASIQFSADGKTLLTSTGSYGTFNCWKSDGTRLTPSSISANSEVLSPDGASVIGSDQTHGTFKYDIASLTYTATYAVPSGAVIGLTANGTQLLATSGSTAYEWDMASNKAITSFPIAAAGQDSMNYGMGTGAILSPDGTVLAIAGSSMFFYNVTTGVAINPSTILASYGSSFGIHPDDARFIAQYRSGQGNAVGLFNMTDGSASHLFDAPVSLGNSSGVAISPNGKLAAAVYGTTLRIWDVK